MVKEMTIHEARAVARGKRENTLAPLHTVVSGSRVVEAEDPYAIFESNARAHWAEILLGIMTWNIDTDRKQMLYARAFQDMDNWLRDSSLIYKEAYFEHIAIEELERVLQDRLTELPDRDNYLSLIRNRQ